MTRLLSVAEQGWYYAFLSLSAVYFILDFGLSTLLVPITAKHFIDLVWGDRGRIMGQGSGVFFDLCRRACIWYGASSAIYLVLVPIGLVFFRDASPLPYDWRPAWVGVVVATALSQSVLPWPALAEGSGQIGVAYGVRLAQGVVSALATWVALILGAGLYSLIAAPLANFCVTAGWLCYRRPLWIIGILKAPTERFQWRSELHPLQWRIGIAWVCGYVVGQIHVPILFRMQGPIAAAQMGLALTVMNMLILLSQSWVTSQVPQMTQLVIRRAWSEMDSIFGRGLRVALLAYLLMSIVVLLLSSFAPPGQWTDRILPTAQLSGLLLAGVCTLAYGLLSSQVRCYRRDPFVAVSAVSAMVLVALVILLVPRFGTAGDVSALLVVSGGMSLPWVAAIYWRSNQRWRSTPMAT